MLGARTSLNRSTSPKNERHRSYSCSEPVSAAKESAVLCDGERSIIRPVWVPRRIVGVYDAVRPDRNWASRPRSWTIWSGKRPTR